jgi:hypothetical protein
MSAVKKVINIMEKIYIDHCTLNFNLKYNQVDPTIIVSVMAIITMIKHNSYNKIIFLNALKIIISIHYPKIETHKIKTKYTYKKIKKKFFKHIKMEKYIDPEKISLEILDLLTKKIY